MFYIDSKLFKHKQDNNMDQPSDYKFQIVTYLQKQNDPISVKNISKNLKIPKKYVKKVIKENPKTIERGSPIEVGCGKWQPNNEKDIQKHKCHKRLISIWRLKQFQGD